jgi:hypothetical protein
MLSMILQNENERLLVLRIVDDLFGEKALVYNHVVLLIEKSILLPLISSHIIDTNGIGSSLFQIKWIIFISWLEFKFGLCTVL